MRQCQAPNSTADVDDADALLDTARRASLTSLLGAALSNARSGAENLLAGPIAETVPHVGRYATLPRESTTPAAAARKRVRQCGRHDAWPLDASSRFLFLRPAAAASRIFPVQPV